MRAHAALPFIAAILAAVPMANADIVYDETGRDLSGDRFAPTLILIHPGDNTLIGIIDGDDGTGRIDRDYYTFTVPAGHHLAEIRLNDYLSVDFAAFYGIQPGTVFPDDPETVRPGDLLGWTLFGPNQVGDDLLPLMGANGQTFTPPLPSGDYAFWCQQLDNYTEYAMTFVVEPVPSPGACSMVVCLVGGAVARRRRRG